jgi:TolB-like protein
MKSILSLTMLLLFSIGVFSQGAVKSDVILKLNGEELSGKVVEMTDTEVKFTYTGETLVYAIKKNDILKITFASGRIEVLNKQPLPSESKPESSGNEPVQPSQQQGAMENHRNKVAILPFAFIKDDQEAVDVMSEKAQNATYSYLTKHAGIFTIIEPRTSNALLIKAGINKENIKGYTMDDLCNLLGVEYIIEGIVMVNKGIQTNYSSNNGTLKGNNNNKNNSNNKTTYNSSSYNSTTQNYETSLNLNIFNDKGVSVFSQERKSFWNTQDAYKATLEYLLKRTPLYSK